MIVIRETNTLIRVPPSNCPSWWQALKIPRHDIGPIGRQRCSWKTTNFGASRNDVVVLCYVGLLAFRNSLTSQHRLHPLDLEQLLLCLTMKTPTATNLLLLSTLTLSICNEIAATYSLCAIPRNGSGAAPWKFALNLELL